MPTATACGTARVQPKNKVRICFAAYDYPARQSGGGVGRQVQILARRLAKAGHSATVIALRGDASTGESLDDEGVQVHYVVPSNLHWYIYRIPRLGAVLALALREIEYSRVAFRAIQALHAQQPFDLIEGTETGANGLSKLDTRLPLLIRLHGEQYTFRKYTSGLPLTNGVKLARHVQRSAIRSAQMLISPSRAHASEIAGEFAPQQLPITVIPNCVELEPSLPTISEPGRGLNVLYVGRLEKGKGLVDLLLAARLVLHDIPEVKLILAGASQPTLPTEELDELIISNGLSGKVERLGQVGRERLGVLYRAASVCVLPSYYESFGLAALEAMSCGVAVVGTRVGGLPEVVEHGVTGLLVAPGDANALAKALLDLLTDPERRESMGRLGRERAERLFSADSVFDMNMCMYQQAIGARA